MDGKIGSAEVSSKDAAAGELRPAFFRTVGGDPQVVRPEPHAAGFWDPTMLFGRLVGGLLARAIDRDEPDPDFECTRLTVDLFRTAPLGPPITCDTSVIRQGRRIRVKLATLSLGGDPVAQATAVLLRRGEQPPHEHLATPRWRQAPPAHDQQTSASPTGAPATWDSWMAHTGPSTGAAAMREGIWMREIHHLVDDEPPTPLQRAALAGDLANGVTSSAPQGVSFINADYTIYIGRPPAGELIGIEPTGHISGDGIAVGEARLHDIHGPFGFVATTGVANKPPR